MRFCLNEISCVMRSKVTLMLVTDVGREIPFSPPGKIIPFSPPRIFLFWNVPILGGVFGILKENLKVEKLVFSNNVIPKYRFLHLEVITLGFSSDQYSSFGYFSCKISEKWTIWIPKTNFNFLSSYDKAPVDCADMPATDLTEFGTFKFWGIWLVFLLLLKLHRCKLDHRVWFLSWTLGSKREWKHWY